MKKSRTARRRKSIAAPQGVLNSSVKNCGRVEREVVTLGPEVVVDHVEEDHQAEAVRLVDQRLEVVGAAVGPGRRVGQDAVVAPVARARPLGDRHQLDRGDAELGEVGEASPRAGEGALRAEGADVQLVEHRLGPGPAAPLRVPPRVAARVDDQRGAVHGLGLAARGRVGHLLAALQREQIGLAGTGRGVDLVPAAIERPHRLAQAAGRQDEADLPLARRPEAEAGVSFAEEERAEGGQGTGHDPPPTSASTPSRRRGAEVAAGGWAAGMVSAAPSPFVGRIGAPRRIRTTSERPSSG